MEFMPSHRLAQTNYPIRIGSFAYSFVVFVMLISERHLSLGAAQLAFPVFSLLIYPHLAFVHTRIARDAHLAELNNLLIDAVLLGMVAAQAGLALWLGFAFLLAIGVNNAVCAGARRLAIGLSLCAGSALAGYLLLRPVLRPETSPVVTALCAAGITAYVSAVGLVVRWQNKHLVETRDALRRREEQFRFIAEHAGDFIAVLDAKGRLVYTSGAYLERFDANLIAAGAPWTELIDPAHRARAREFLISVLKTGTSARTSLGFVAADGARVELESSGSLMLDGEDRRLLVTSHAPSQREQSIESRFAKELGTQSTRSGLIITSIMGRVEFASPGMALLTGHGPGGLIGKTIEEIAEAIPASDSLMDTVWRSLESIGQCRCKMVLIHKSGQLKLAWANVVPVNGADKEALRYAWILMEDEALAAVPKEPAPI